MTTVTSDLLWAADLLRGGRLVAFPTETVYGLGANIWNSAAIDQIFQAKGRPQDNPLIVHIHSERQLDELVTNRPETANRLIQAFWPGPLTLVFPRNPNVSPRISAGMPSLAIRLPSHTLAQEFLRLCEVPVAAPSANRSGRPSATTWQAVLEDLGGRVDAILQGEPAKIGLESTVVDCTGEHPKLLRAGGITLEQLRCITPDIAAATRLATESSAGGTSSPLNSQLNSPGLRYRHYQPNAPVRIVTDIAQIEGKQEQSLLTLSEHPDPNSFGWFVRCADLSDYANRLYEFFRESDRRQIREILCEDVPRNELGRAIGDRLDRASQK